MTPSKRLATAVNTSAGWVGLARTELGLRRCTLYKSTKRDALADLGEGWETVDDGTDALLKKAERLVRDHASGKRIKADIKLDLTGIPPFTRKALEACHAIPYGETRTYGDLATAAGSPKAARAAGQAMANNPIPILIPCHRVVGSDGNLTGFAGGTEGLGMKEAMLAKEGVTA